MLIAVIYSVCGCNMDQPLVMLSDYIESRNCIIATKSSQQVVIPRGYKNSTNC